MRRIAAILSTSYALFIALTLLLPSVTASTATVSIVDLRHFDPSIFKFNGATAWGFRPVISTVQAGGSVTFTNKGSDFHTVTSFTTRTLVNFEGAMINLPVPDGAFDSGPIAVGSSFTINTASLTPGTHWIFCQFHPWMVGAVVVSDSGSATVSSSIVDSGGVGSQFFAGSAAWGFIARITQVKQGTTVSFTNNGNIAHTVTSGLEGALDSGALFNFIPVMPGDTVSLDTSSLAPGVYQYHCDFHPWMVGTLIISA